MVGRAPDCLPCVHFQGHPRKYGDSTCCELVGNISEDIYWNGRKCDLYEMRPEIETKLKETGL